MVTEYLQTAKISSCYIIKFMKLQLLYALHTTKNFSLLQFTDITKNKVFTVYTSNPYYKI